MGVRLPPVDLELESRVSRARTAGHLAERALRDDDRALEELELLRGKLRGAINAIPQLREDVLAACDALEAFAREHAS